MILEKTTYDSPVAEIMEIANSLTLCQTSTDNLVEVDGPGWEY